MHFTGSGGHHTSLDSDPQAPTPASSIMLESKLRIIGPVTFPEWTGERIYMHPLMPGRKLNASLSTALLPDDLARWRKTVAAMLDGVDVPEKTYLMVDQGKIKAGATHRRGGPHIDGNWVEDELAITRHVTIGKKRFNKQICFPKETLILASDVAACVAYLGEFDGRLIGSGGDCSKIDLSKLIRVELKPGIAYAGNVTMIHESIPVKRACKRTLVRLNVPGV